jgi:hypothetical protein
MTKELFLLWQTPSNNKWLPIGKLLYDAKEYFFKYTIGAEWARNKENFIAFSQMNYFKNRIDRLEKNSSLYLMRDIQNKFDSSALVLRTDDPAEIVGYCPAFFVDEFNKLIDRNHAENVKLSVVKVNSEAPLQFRLLCKLSTLWPSDFISFDQEAFQTIIN